VQTGRQRECPNRGQCFLYVPCTLLKLYFTCGQIGLVGSMFGQSTILGGLRWLVDPNRMQLSW